MADTPLTPEMPPAENPDPPTGEKKQPYAIGLVSGGMDSTLAIEVMKKQGFKVKSVHFYTGFCVSELHRRVGGNRVMMRNVRNEAKRAEQDTNSEIEMHDISDEYIDMVLNPKHGYGKNMNPCIDCRIMMLNKTKEIMEREGADMIFTGEVLGQRPMSQHHRALKTIEQETELEGKLIRPLSARRLSKTDADRKGWLDKDQLPGITGRSRKPQLELAREFGIDPDRLPNPAGGCCFLVDPNYARKFRDYVVHKNEALPEGQKLKVTHEEVLLLGVGRHLRLGPRTKLIVGREEDENQFIERQFGFLKNRHHYVMLTTPDHPGPTAVGDGEWDEEQLRHMAEIVARYCDGKNEPEVRVTAEYEDGTTRDWQVRPAEPSSIEPLFV